MMRLFYINYPNCQTLSGNLRWSHYCELLSISEKSKRDFYEKESIQSSWSVRELKRQIETSLFERLLLSKGEIHQKEVMKLSQTGNIIETPRDILKDPYVFEFLDMSENKPILERDLEKNSLDTLKIFSWS